MHFDWQSVEDQLYIHSRAEIKTFADAHMSETVSFFAFNSVYYEGYFQLCFDTLSNSLEIARRTEGHAIDRRMKMLSTDEAWRGAAYFITNPAVVDYAQETGDFIYCLPSGLLVNQIHDMFLGGNYPGGEEGNDDYIAGNTLIVLWKTVERLIAANAFADFKLASPFRVGCQLSGNPLVVLRILNWPEFH
jgi:hypothetical protein